MLEDMLTACGIDLKLSWDDHLPLIKFAYNNSYQANIQMASFEALYGKGKTPTCWEEIGERRLLGPELVKLTIEKIRVIREKLFTTQSRQKSYVDQRIRELEF